MILKGRCDGQDTTGLNVFGPDMTGFNAKRLNRLIYLPPLVGLIQSSVI